VLGAALGAALAGSLYYLIFIHADLRLKPLALLVGFLGGLGARLLSKDRSKELGALVALIAVAAIVGAQYLVAVKWFNEEESPSVEKSNYEQEVAHAQEVLKAVPNASDQEIRIFLAKEMAEEGEKPDLKAVGREDIQEFREAELPYYRDLASGKITQEAYDKENTITLTAEDRQKEKEESERTFKWVFMALMLSKFNIVCMVGAAGIGYKMVADA
jgi:hypothetical protein